VTTGLQNPAFVPVCGLPTTYWLFETTDSAGFVVNTGKIECDEVSSVLFTELLYGSISVTRGTDILATASTYTFKFRVTTAVPKGGFFRLVLRLEPVGERRPGDVSLRNLWIPNRRLGPGLDQGQPELQY